jgi:iron transport multicopper oxidase
MTVSDWYHDEMPGLLAEFISYANPTGAEPVPNSALMNDTQNFTVAVQPGKTYFFRLTNIGAFAGQYFWIEGHTMRIIEVDGVYTEPAETDMIYLTTAQRYGFLVTAKDDASANFAMVSSMDEVSLPILTY